MSGNNKALELKEEDVAKFLCCTTQLGSQNLDFQMQQYAYKRSQSGNYIINIRRIWEKLLLAARAIAAIETPGDVCVISGRPFGQRAVLKFASYTGATPIAGRFTPGAFTNQNQAEKEEQTREQFAKDHDFQAPPAEVPTTWTSEPVAVQPADWVEDTTFPVETPNFATTDTWSAPTEPPPITTNWGDTVDTWQ